jgi:hypothetical protein
MPVIQSALHYYQNGCNILIKKSQDGDEKAVDELLAQGGNLTDAIYGYAFGGHEALVNTVLESHPELIEAAVRGYARAKNTAQINKLPSDSSEQRKKSLIFGFAQAGDETQVRAALNAKGGSHYLPIVLEALASTGQKELLCELMAGTDYYNTVLKAAAKSGRDELVNDLLAQRNISRAALIPLSDATQTTLSYVLEGYTEGRHFREAAQILSLGINPMCCLNALSFAGRLDSTDASLLLASIDDDVIKASVQSLMVRQFDLDVGTLDFEWVNEFMEKCSELEPCHTCLINI